MTFALLLYFGIYILALLLLLFGWEMQTSKPLNEVIRHLKISIIVPLRNEARNIAALVESLQKLKYPNTKLEVILVDDHSEDETPLLLLNLPAGFTLIKLTNTSGKKAALSQGIKIADGEIIVTTDADCIHNPQWLESINRQFQNDGVHLVVGGVKIQGANFFHRLQAMEFASLVGSGAAMLQFGMPVMANGANLSFRKSTFEAVNGYSGNEHLASGDDEFLLKKVHSIWPGGITFNSDQGGIVQTSAQTSLGNFLHQRLRWASKWKVDKNPRTRWVGFMVILLQVGFLGCLVFLFLTNADLAKLVVLGKVALDGIFLWKVSSFLGVKFSLPAFILLEIIYPFYVFVVGVWSQFTGFEWKGRKY